MRSSRLSLSCGQSFIGVRVAQLEVGGTVNHAVDSPRPSWVKLTKAFSKLLTLKLLNLLNRDLNLEAPSTTLISWAR